MKKIIQLFLLLCFCASLAYAQKAVQIGKLWGFEDGTGNVVIPAVFDEAQDFSDGMAAVKKGKKWGYINEKGDIVIDYQYSAALPFNEGHAVVGDCYSVLGITVPVPSKNCMVINKDGIITGKFEKKDAIYAFASPFSDGLALFVRTPKRGFKPKQTYGFINTKGQIVIDPSKYTLAEPFEDGVAKVTSEDNGGGYIDTKENFFRNKQDAYLAVNGTLPQEKPSNQNSSNNLAQNTQQTPVVTVPKSDVDLNIPLTNRTKDDTFVLIIANENYEFVDDVQFALNDGQTFKEYCIKTLGVPERQVWVYDNASLGIIAGGIDKMVQAMKIFDNAKAIVYYCGHGIPDEKTGDAFIVPVDGKGTNTMTCYSLNNLYQTIASANPSNVTYFMDACFTGANREGSMLVAARGVAREPKKADITGNTVVFSAASGDETAMPYKEKGHGLFTYFLLKKLQDTKGDVTYGELADFINSNVKKEAFLTNEKPQNPVVATSNELKDDWKGMNLK